MSEDIELNQRVRLSTLRGLWGHVPPSLRAVSVDIDYQKVYFRCIFDGIPSEDDCEMLSCAATEVIADFSAPYTIKEEYLHIKYPNPMSHLRFLIFLRFEEPTPM